MTGTRDTTYMDRCRAAVEADGIEFDERLAAVASMAGPDERYVLRMHRERAAKRPALPRYDGPPPETAEEGDALIKEIGRKYSALSAEATAAIVRLRGEADRPADEEPPPAPEDQAAGIPEAEASTEPPADRGPEGLEEDQAPEAPAPPARKARPVPKPTGAGLEFPLWGDVIMKVYPETRGAYPVEILRGETRICIEAPKSPPWLSTKLQDTLITGIMGALGEEGRSREFVKKKVADAFAAIVERRETDDETRRALTPAPVRRLMEETESVIVYPGEATFYEVTIAGRTLTITAAQMARVEPGFINAAVLNAFPLDPLDASKSDWKAIKDYWLSPDVAEVRDREETSEAEIVIERFRLHCEGVTLVASAEALTADTLAWNDEADKLVWIIGTRIARFIEENQETARARRPCQDSPGRGDHAPADQDDPAGPSSKQVRGWGLREDFCAKFKVPGGGVRVRDVMIARRGNK